MLHKTRVANRFRAKKLSPQTTLEILRWYACGADGRAGGRCTVKSGYSDSQMEAILGFNCLH